MPPTTTTWITSGASRTMALHQHLKVTLFPLDILPLENQEAVTAAMCLSSYNVDRKKSTNLQSTSEDN